MTAGDVLLPSWTPGTQVIRWAGPGDPPTASDVILARSSIGVALTSAPGGGTVRWLAWH